MKLTKFESLSNVVDSITNNSPKLKDGRVWCHECSNNMKVDSELALKNGWPKCCGYTMSLDKPNTANQIE